MKKFVIIIAIINFALTVTAQTSYANPVLLSPLSENTIIKINGKKKELQSILICNKNAQIEILTGKVSLLSATGNEISFRQGKKIKIIEDPKQLNALNNAFSINKISKFMDKPSVYLPNLYNCDRNEYLIFPLKSKVSDKSTVKFYFSQKFTAEMEFKLYLGNSDSLIWHTNGPVNDFDFQNLPIIPEQLYTWKIYNGSNSLKGEIVLLSKSQTRNLGIGPLHNKIDYLNAFFTFLENECRFDAVAILLAATEEYPKSELFKSMVNQLPIKLTEQ